MISLAILAALLLAIWLWVQWRRLSNSDYAADWAYIPLVAAIAAAIMAIGMWIR